MKALLIEAEKLLKENDEVLKRRAYADIAANRMTTTRISLNYGGKPAAGVIIRIKQKSHDFGFGCNLFLLNQFSDVEDNVKYQSSVAKVFNTATLPFYWNAVEPEQDKPRYTADSFNIFRRPAPDICVEYCRSHNIEPKLHCLFYDKFIPDWLENIKDQSTVKKLYEKRFREIAERYSPSITQYEVTNETLQARYWKRMSVLTPLRDILDWCFCMARKYLPDKELIINEGNPIEYFDGCGFRDAYFMQIEGLLNRGVSVDKVGIQQHFFANASEELSREDVKIEKLWKYNAAERNYAFLDAYSQLGLPIQLTEVTVPTLEDSEYGREIQALLLRQLMIMWFSHKSIDSVIYWNTVDHMAYDSPDGKWLENKCLGGLLNRDLSPKPAYLMLDKLINQEWHTETVLKTNVYGIAEFTGFRGNYEAEIVFNGKKHNKFFHTAYKANDILALTLSE